MFISAEQMSKVEIVKGKIENTYLEIYEENENTSHLYFNRKLIAKNNKT